MLAARVEDQLIYFGQSTENHRILWVSYNAIVVPSQLQTLHLVASSLSK